MLRKLKKREAIVGLVMLLVGLGLLIATTGIKVNTENGVAPRVFPMAGAVLIALLGSLKLVLSEPQTNIENEDKSSLGPIFALASLSIGYVLLITHFGYLVSTSVVAPVALFLFGIRSRTGLLAAIILCPLVYHVIFFVGLGVFPPYGLQFDLLDLIQGL